MLLELQSTTSCSTFVGSRDDRAYMFDALYYYACLLCIPFDTYVHPYEISVWGPIDAVPCSLEQKHVSAIYFWFLFFVRHRCQTMNFDNFITQIIWMQMLDLTARHELPLWLTGWWWNDFQLLYYVKFRYNWHAGRQTAITHSTASSNILQSIAVAFLLLMVVQAMKDECATPTTSSVWGLQIWSRKKKIPNS